MAHVQEFLQPGDNLLYGAKGLFGWIISLKTWHSIAHCEGYAGAGKSVASRDGVGVGLYDLRLDRLRFILRPRRPFNLVGAMYAFEHFYRGQGYDFAGLLRFGWRAPVDAIRFNNKQFCSEFLTRWDRNGDLDPFNGEDADAIAPFEFLLSPVFSKYEVTPDGEVLDHVGEGAS